MEGEITEWLCGATFVVKPSGGMRLVTDLVHLNGAVKCPTHPFAPMNDNLSALDSKAKFLLTLDSVGVHRLVVLSKEVSSLPHRMGRLHLPQSPHGLYKL